MDTALAIVFHDPEGRLMDQAGRTLPVLSSAFPALAVYASSATDPALLQLFAAAGALTRQPQPGVPDIQIGQGRRSVLELGLQAGSDFLLYCDGDRALHWADRFGPEIEAAGGYATWLATLEKDPRQWLWRLEVARLEIAALLDFSA